MTGKGKVISLVGRGGGRELLTGKGKVILFGGVGYNALD